jgi:hypothetical protein
MANEITTTVSLRFSKGGASASVNETARADMAGSDFLNQVQTIGTTAEAVSFGNITGPPGFVAIKNLDAANFVEFGGDSGLTVFKLILMPGKTMLASPASGTLFGKADTAAVDIQVLAIEA